MGRERRIRFIIQSIEVNPWLKNSVALKGRHLGLQLDGYLSMFRLSMWVPVVILSTPWCQYHPT